MIDVGRKGDITRLYDAQEDSRDALRPFRQDRVNMIQEYAGSVYGSGGSPRRVISNWMNLTAKVATIGLAADNPRVRITTQHRDLWSFAYRWQQSLNNFIKEIHFRETMQDCVLDSFFSWGIGKVFQAEWESIQLDDELWADPGKPHFMRISPDDFVLDMSVKDIRRCRFMSDEYRVSWQSVKEDPDFDKAVVKEIRPNSKWQREYQEANDIGTGDLTDDDDLEPMIDLNDVWLPETNQVATFPRYYQTKPLKVMEVGPEGSPYKILRLGSVPDNLVPSTPGQQMYHLHKIANLLARKHVRQALRQTTNFLYQPNSAADAERSRTADDGEYIKSTNPKGVQAVSHPGVNANTAAYSLSIVEDLKQFAGNLDARAGLGPQAQTLGQEQLIHGAVSAVEAADQARVHAFAVEVLGTIGHLMWVDEFLEVPASFEISPGSGVHADASWTPEMREGDFWQYNFDIEQDSMRYEPAEAKVAKLERFLDRVERLVPLAPGMAVDAQEALRQLADELGRPELSNILTFSEEPSIDRPGPAGKPANTTRTTIRRSSVPTGGTPQNRSSVMQQALLGANQTPQQLQSLSR